MANHWLTASQPLVIGHRGASGDAPENTLAAFRLARAQGADGVEYDVHLASDGVPVVIHDLTLERTAGIAGRVVDMTSEQLGKVDVGDGEPVPTLTAVLSELDDDCLHNIELKRGSGSADEIVTTIADLLAQHPNLHENIVVSSFDAELLAAAQQTFSAPIALAALIDPEEPSIPADFAGRIVHPYYLAVDADFMSWAAEKAYRVNVWTLDSAERAQRLVAMGVSAVITNYPAIIRAAL